MKDIIEYADFAKLDIRAGIVVSCEKVENAEKLYRLRRGKSLFFKASSRNSFFETTNEHEGTRIKKTRSRVSKTYLRMRFRSA